MKMCIRSRPILLGTLKSKIYLNTLYQSHIQQHDEAPGGLVVMAIHTEANYLHDA